MNQVHDYLHEQIFDAIPLGLFLIANDHTICAWNKWLVQHTQISVEQALGKTLKSLYPDTTHARFDWALDAVLNHRYPQILSATLNQYVIPIPLVKHVYVDLNMMQQNIEILPFRYNKQNMALVIIQDVSDKIHLKNTLITMAARYETNSLLDALTGLYNRRFLWKFLGNELRTAKREQYTIICCLFDLDHFKRINDELGHQAGDEVLRSFTTLVTEHMRPKDYFIRYGGEEFIVILTHISIENAIEWANRMRKILEAQDQHGFVHKKITCSGGLAYWQPSDPMINAEKLVNQADRELYKAKEMGRNCIVVQGRKV